MTYQLTIGGKATVNSENGLTFTGTYTVAPTDTSGKVTFLIIANDLAGNQLLQYTVTDGSSVTIDTVPPTINNVHIISNNINGAYAKANDVITLTFTTSKAVRTTPNVTLAGRVAKVYSTGINAYTANITVLSSDGQGSVNLSIYAQDYAYNNGSTTAVSDSSYVTIDIVPNFFQNNYFLIQQKCFYGNF